jgi:hypothetical protein
VFSTRKNRLNLLKNQANLSISSTLLPHSWFDSYKSLICMRKIFLKRILCCFHIYFHTSRSSAASELASVEASFSKLRMWASPRFCANGVFSTQHLAKRNKPSPKKTRLTFKIRRAVVKRRVSNHQKLCLMPTETPEALALLALPW